MRRPFRRLINGHYWKIRFVSRSEMPSHAWAKRKNHRLFGETDRENRTIWIDETLRGQALIDTLAHEWHHAEGDDKRHRTVDRKSRQLAALLALAPKVAP
jgi:hypothetical protein